MQATQILKKMRWKGQEILLVNAPQEIHGMMDVPFTSSESLTDSGLIMLFVNSSEEVAQYLESIKGLDLSESVFWIAYPKKSSRLASDLSRDIVWNMMRGIGLTGVSLVSINENWSIARYKPESDVTHSPKGSMDLPEELFELLRTDDKARAFFFSLSATNRKEYISWIVSAKKPETKKRRLEQILDRLNDGLKNPSEKRS